MRAARGWLVGAALVAAAGVIVAITPDEDAQDGPFLVHGVVEQSITSRELVVSVLDASFADRITVEDDDWSADGNWLVVDLSAAARGTEVDATVRLVKLVVDGRVFVASERPSTSLLGAELRVGIETDGMVAFELPEDLTPGEAEIRLSPPYRTPNLDDVIVVHLDLGETPRVGSIDIVEPSIGASS